MCIPGIATGYCCNKAKELLHCGRDAFPDNGRVCWELNYPISDVRYSSIKYCPFCGYSLPETLDELMKETFNEQRNQSE